VSAANADVPRSVDCAEPFGRVLATFHNAADDFVAPAGSEWTQPSRFALMGADTGWLETLYSHDAKERAVLVGWWHQATAVLTDAAGSDLGMCHGEAVPASFRIVGGELAVAELDWAGEGDRVYDLATYRWALALHAKDVADDRFRTFLHAYAEFRVRADLGPLRAWVAARHFWSMRLAAGFANPAGLSRRASFAASWDIEAG
jgi:Ser/Thr protein kinase RdoA (MazF antagonist)